MTTTNPPVNLFKAMHKARAAMGIVPKGGHNKFDKYDYAKLDDYIDVIQKPCDDNALIVISTIDNIEWCDDRATKQGGSEKVCRVHLRTEVIHVESGESTSVTVMGEGQDRGDKAAYKAYTGARKYALANLFNLATGDDPETDSHEPPENPFRREQPKPTQHAAAPPAPKPDVEVAKKKAEMNGWPLDKIQALIAAADSVPLLDFVVDGAEGGQVWNSIVGRGAIIEAIRGRLGELFKTMPASSRNAAVEEAFKVKMKRHVDKLELDKQFAETETKFEQQEAHSDTGNQG